jgi:hypothetical protein
VVKLLDTNDAPPVSAGLLWPTIVASLVPFSISLALNVIAIFGFHAHDVMLPAHVAFFILLIVGGITSTLIAVGALGAFRLLPRFAHYHTWRLCMFVCALAIVSLLSLWPLHELMVHHARDYFALAASVAMISLLLHYFGLKAALANEYLHLACSDRCAACGYSLRGRGSSGGKCPECGATTIKQKAETQKAEME